MADQSGYFGRIVTLWLEKLSLSDQHKQKEFSTQANEAMRYYNGPHTFMYEGGEGSAALSQGDICHPDPIFKMTANKVYEVVCLFLPVLYHRNPIRTVTPGKNPVSDGTQAYIAKMFPPDNSQMMRHIRADLLGCYLNKTPLMNDLLGSARNAILEGLVKGRGVLWPGLLDGPGYFVAGSEYDSVDHLFIDPDAEKITEARWVARRRIRDKADVEKEYGLPAGTLKGNSGESSAQTARINVTSDGVSHRRKGGTDDLITYYEVYSRMGMGTRKPVLRSTPVDPVDEFWNSLGQNIYLVIADGCDYPLNLPPDQFMQLEENQAIEEIMARTSWPTPFHENSSWPWPFAPIDFHEVARSVWPVSHVGPALGYQQFLNWAYSFLASKVCRTGRDILAVPDGAAEDFRKQINGGADLVVVPVGKGHAGTTNDEVKVIQFPPMNANFMQVVDRAEMAWDKAVGTNELLYGMGGKQMRSAQEAAVRDKNTSIRPDDMANRVEDWMSLVALMEAIVARTHLKPEDVAPVFNEEYSPPPEPDELMGIPDPNTAPAGTMGPYTTLWQELLHSDDVSKIVSEFEYRIEAGSAKKPNKASQLESSTQVSQILMPILQQQYMMTGDPTEINKMLRMMGNANDWPDLIQLPDLSQMMMQQQQAAQPQPMEGGQPPVV